MAIYTGYFDESSEESQPHLVMGGLILDAERAAEFDQDWRIAIKGLPPMPKSTDREPFLHTADFVSGSAQYYPEWKGRYEEKLAILSAAARVISRYTLQIITPTIDMEDYRAIDSYIKLSEAVGHPYTVASMLAYQHMLSWGNRNSVSGPIKMVLEARNGIGDVIEMFRINGYPIPSPESKGLPQLQAADYIAWMRLKKYEPTSSFERVKDSWNEIGKFLYTDQPYMFSDLMDAVVRLAAQHPEIHFPLRADDCTLITYKHRYKSPRRPFKRTAKRKPMADSADV